MSKASRNGSPPRAALSAKLEALPARPGVYLLKDEAGAVLYVGKAKGLRTRVQSYFRGGDGRYQIDFLVKKVADLECLVTRNEKEALILENNLIKQYKPRYNVRLKDDKSYVSVKMTTQDPWPRVVVTRRIVRDGSRYFGPFPSSSSLRGTIDVIRKVFPLRTCSDTVFRNRSRPCLEYQIKRCLAPCVLDVDRAEYEGHLQSAALLLEGKDQTLRKKLEARMEAASRELRFEDAARLRDQIRAVQATGERQEVVTHEGVDQDVFGLYREGGFLEVQVLLVRSGRLTANQSFGFTDWEFPDEEVLGDVLTQFYQGTRVVPRQVLLPIALEDQAARVELLRERRKAAVSILVPQRGVKRRLLDLARENARQAFLERRDAQERLARTSEELRRRLRLRSAPKRMECVDISTFQGGETVGSVVAFDEGRPDTGSYRRYRIRSVEGVDDFASLRELLGRRLAAGLKRQDLPDLLVIDGGRGQLGVALAVCKELGVADLDVVGLAKSRAVSDPRAKEVERIEERVFLAGRTNPVVLARNSNALFLLQRIRDEAHRFAVGFHTKLRHRARLRSPLDEIPGVGGARRKALLAHFGSVARLRRASPEDLSEVPGVGARLAETIHRALAKTD